ncbi:MAG: multicopper oxidase family protein, partial [Armatimonadetes bacterium]|nr:multicopper oxidase family protein [Armatimonadota bacterium]NIO96890.1 multicopper oxidase family protein [Armatimonadota bacterium]
MKFNRRGFLASAAAMAVAPQMVRAASAPTILEAKTGRVRLINEEFGDYPETEIWGFN